MSRGATRGGREPGVTAIARLESLLSRLEALNSRWRCQRIAGSGMPVLPSCFACSPVHLRQPRSVFADHFRARR
jgi:hypothetical protein